MVAWKQNMLILLLFIGMGGLVWQLARERSPSMMDQLFMAIEKNDVKKAYELIQKGADVNYIKSFFIASPKTPLQKAIESGSPDMVALLLKHGASPSKLQDDLSNPLDIAIAIARGELMISKSRMSWEQVRENQKKIIPLLLSAKAKSEIYSSEAALKVLMEKK